MTEPPLDRAHAYARKIAAIVASLGIAATAVAGGAEWLVAFWRDLDRGTAMRIVEMEAEIEEAGRIARRDADRRDAAIAALRERMGEADAAAALLFRRLDQLEDGYALVLTLDADRHNVRDRLVRIETLIEAGIMARHPLGKARP